MGEVIPLRGPSAPTTKDEQKAVARYALLAYDVEAFLEEVPEMTDGALATLYKILSLPNPKHTEDTRQLNAFGADVVRGQLEGRGLSVPEEG